MNPERLRDQLEENGELMVNVADFDHHLELHIHDTEIGDETVQLELADATLEFAVDQVIAAWKHYHSLADYGLE